MHRADTNSNHINDRAAFRGIAPENRNVRNPQNFDVATDINDNQSRIRRATYPVLFQKTKNTDRITRAEPQVGENSANPIPEASQALSQTTNPDTLLISGGSRSAVRLANLTRDRPRARPS